mgnify:CR=1 FL=1
MHVLKKYKAVLLSGLLVVVFCVAAYCAVGRADSADSQYTYAEHIFQDDTVNEINIEIDEADWQDMLENPLEEEYHKANITINGETVGNVAIRTKGNNSLTSVASSDSDRYSFKIDFDYYDDNSNYYGLKKLCLNNNYADNSSMREYISYKIMGELGLDVPQCGYSNITVNGEEWGLYLAVEAIDETFLETHFDDATGDLYKPEGQDGTGADLVYDGDDISSYTGLNLKTNEDTSDGKEIIALMKALEDGENLEDLLDVESALKYIAANVALANFDSYLGNTTHNYYLYEEDGYFTVIPWDMNLAFGGFGGGGAKRNGPRRGKDVNVSIQLTFEEAVFGCKKEISIAIYDECETCHGTGAKAGSHPESCPTCHGTGQERVMQQSMFGSVTSVRTCSKCGGPGKLVKDPCNPCHGSGKVRKTKKYEVNVPKGIDNGQTIRLAGKGEIGENGGGYGDLLVTVYVQPNRVFVRKGYDIYCDVPITFVQAALGGEITIKTIDGEEKYTVKPGTQPDTVVTLRGVGVPNLRNPKVRGNQIVTLKVKIPTDMSERQKDLLRQFYGDAPKAATEAEAPKEEKKSFSKKMKDFFKED